MGRKLTTKEFIDKAVSVHGSKYEYSKVDYTLAHNKVTILCKNHGYFSMQAYCHTNLKQGCPKCAIDDSKKRYSKSLGDFITDANRVHGEKYDYSKSNYVNSATKITITCISHNLDFKMRPNNHLLGQGCRECAKEAKTNSTKDFIKKAVEVHGNKYSYSNSIYSRGKDSILITCKIHGDVSIIASGHLVGRGCPKCGAEDCGFTKTFFKNRCSKNIKGLGVLYVIKCYNECEVFYKVGITSSYVGKRFGGSVAMPYNYKVIKELKLPPDFVYDTENTILRDLAGYKYKPKISFGGETECFSKLEPILKLLDKLLEKEGFDENEQ